MSNVTDEPSESGLVSCGPAVPGRCVDVGINSLGRISQVRAEDWFLHQPADACLCSSPLLVCRGPHPSLSILGKGIVDFNVHGGRLYRHRGGGFCATP